MRTITPRLLIPILLLLAFASPAAANCVGGQVEPFQHSFGGYLENCADSRPVAAYLFALSSGVSPDTTCPNDASCNGGAVDAICEDNSVANAQGGVCQAEAGTPGDGNVTIS